MTTPFLSSPEFWEVQFLERMPLLFLDKVSIGLFLREKGGEGSGEGRKKRKDSCLERVGGIGLGRVRHLNSKS